ncbi:hypothetical protein [Larkinella arboricola]
MVNPSEQTDLHTDAYPLPQATDSAKRDSLSKKKILAISAAAMLLGGGVYTVADEIQKQPNTETDIERNNAASEPKLNLPVEINVAGKVADTQSFDQAFRSAREEVGIGGVFNWHGRWYNTFEKEEWGSLSLGQRQEFTEMIRGEKLPVKPYVQATDQTETAEDQAIPVETEPTIIEGSLNGQPVMGLDFDQDGIIDTVVLDGGDGHIYRVVDATGDAGLDTVYQYNSLDGEVVSMIRLEQPYPVQ